MHIRNILLCITIFSSYLTAMESPSPGLDFPLLNELFAQDKIKDIIHEPYDTNDKSIEPHESYQTKLENFDGVLLTTYFHVKNLIACVLLTPSNALEATHAGSTIPPQRTIALHPKYFHLLKQKYNQQTKKVSP